MSFITHHTETDGTVLDPWTHETHPRIIDTGWTCTCGAKSGRPKRRDGLHTQAAWHLINKHGAPVVLAGDVAAHERWVVEVWDV